MSSWHEKQLARLSGMVSGSSSSAKVARSGATAFAIFFVGSGLTYLSQIVIARLTGATSYGYYTYALAWITLLAYVAAFGFDVALLRFVAAYRNQAKWDLLHGVVRYAERWVLASGGILVVLGTGIVLARGNQIDPELRNTFLFGFPLIPILALAWIRCAVLRAHDHVIIPLTSSLLVRDGILIALVIFAGVGLGLRVDAQFAMLALLAGASIGLGIASLVKRRIQLKPGAGPSAPAYDVAIWQRAAMPLLVIGAVEVLMNRAGVLCLGWMGETKNAGIFSLAFNIAYLVAIPRTALNTLFAPTVSSLHDSNNHSQLQDLVSKSTLWSLAAATVVGLGLLAGADLLFSLFGKDFVSGLPALRILLVGQVLIAGAGSQLTILTMTGHERSAAALIIVSAIVNVISMFALVYWFGMVGAALAAIGSMIVWNVLMAIFIWRKLNLLPGLLALVAQSSLFVAMRQRYG